MENKTDDILSIGWGTPTTEFCKNWDMSTLLQYFAAHAPVNLYRPESTLELEKLVGRMKPVDSIEVIAWEYEVEAKLRFMYAAAMMAAKK